jgi:hypothetical protein
MTDNKEIRWAWEQAFAHPGEKFSVGRAVACDSCSKDWTELPDSGGFLFGSNSYCPDCAPRALEDIKRFHEEEYIRATCPEGESFADFVRRMRGPDAYIRVSTGIL